MMRSLRMMSVSFWCSSKKNGFQLGAERSFEASTPLCAGVNSDGGAVPCAPLWALESAGRNAAAAPTRTPARNISRRFMKTSRSSVSEHREVYTKAKGKREGWTRRKSDWRVGGQSEGSSSNEADTPPPACPENREVNARRDWSCRRCCARDVYRVWKKWEAVG